MTIRMDEGAAELLDTLHRAGYAAYVWAAACGTVCWALHRTTGTCAPALCRSR